MKVFMLRHQHGGVITSHVFTINPTAEQWAPLAAEAERLHGPGWTRIHEAELVEPDGRIVIDPPHKTVATSAPTIISATGTVT